MDDCVAIPATIGRGGFSSELRYDVSGAGGKRITGSANKMWFLDANGQPIESIPKGVTVQGYVACILVRVDNALATVELPCVPEVGHGEQIKVWLCNMKPFSVSPSKPERR